MKLRYKYLAALSAILTFASCDHDLSTSQDGAFLIKNVRTASIATKGDVEDSLYVSSCGTEGADVYLTISGRVSPIASGCATKASESIINDLKCNNAFTLKGYLGDDLVGTQGASQDDLDNRNFMSTSVDYSSSDNLWHTTGEYKWRNLVTHYFWAYRGGLTSFDVASDFQSAQFSYTSSGQEDLLVASTSDFHKEGDSDVLSGLTFGHALSAVGFDESGIEYKVKDVVNSTTTAAPAGRCVIDSCFFFANREGTCTATHGGFNWSSTTSSRKRQYSPTGVSASESLSFIVPQSSHSPAALVFKDTQRELTYPIVIRLYNSSLDYWDAGTKYIYDLCGTINVPVADALPGINADFAGKGFFSLGVLHSFDVTYIKKLRVTWCGIPETIGNGTFSFISYQDHDPVESEYPTTSSGLAAKSNIGFGYDHKNNKMLKGSIVGNDIVDGVSVPVYEAIMDLTGVTTAQNIYMVFIGGSNGGGSDHAGCNWRVRHMKIEIMEFENIDF